MILPHGYHSLVLIPHDRWMSNNKMLSEMINGPLTEHDENMKVSDITSNSERWQPNAM